MFNVLSRLFGEGAPDLKARLVIIYAFLAVLNIGAWIWALLAFRDTPAMLGIALVIYGLGLRHAVDADHIAAIDNVTRKLMQMKQRPVSVGFFFALGHAAVVVIVAVAVALATSMLGRFESFREVGGVISTSISALFLFVIAAMNIVIFVSIYRSYRRIRAGGTYVEEDLDMLLANRGILSRIFKPMFRLVTRSWHMFPLGFLFGLGFDTATEVAMLSMSASQAANGMPLEAILVLPVLFAAGMSLIDTTDGVMMLGAYEWAFVKPMRKLYYNMTITLVSVLVALLIGGVEALGLIGDKLGFSGSAFDAVQALNDNFNNLGFAVIGVFLAAWLISWVIYKLRRLDDIEVRIAG
ncbi:HoxN/HupN/NixA family nickel/cobalt transporter [Rhizobium halophytocola]|uniref:Nickel/cobalt efflux system n=1 Tax=Rhizobium halophytocola TaxID=735519 RepID=A0ABS4DTM9_9HYPH|nr:HoxN/HupN/NixA family nickel/cobalt transporter [Rhizobium halophytocola]MBP1849047.1 high-affinity nickel-transport protein [Rhizobium halophytocola]